MGLLHDGCGRKFAYAKGEFQDRPTVTVIISGQCSEPLVDIAKRVKKAFEGYGSVKIEEHGEPQPAFDGFSSEEEAVIIVDHEKGQDQDI